MAQKYRHAQNHHANQAVNEWLKKAQDNAKKKVSGLQIALIGEVIAKGRPKRLGGDE